MKTKSISIGNRQISVCESEGEGTPVIFIHGNSLSKEAFSKQLDSELGEKYRLIAFDLPGHGGSDKPNDPQTAYSIPGHVEILRGVIMELQLTDYIVVGHSLGGHIAIEASPELSGARGYVIFGTPPLGIPPAMDKAFLPNPDIGLAFKGELTADEAKTLAGAFINESGDELPDISKIVLGTDPEARAMIAASLGRGEMKDELNILKTLGVPIAIFHGEGDALVSQDYIKSLEIPTLWKGGIQLISNATHSPSLENAGEFNRLLNSFVREAIDYRG